VPDNYDLLGSVPVTVDTGLGKTQTQDQYAAQTKPSGIVFRFLIPPQVNTPEVVAGEADQWASAFEQKMLVSGVQDIIPFGDVNNSGVAFENMTVLVASDDGRFESDLTIPQSQLQSTTFNDKVEAERERLNAMAGI